jgi:hypothetical protein
MSKGKYALRRERARNRKEQESNPDFVSKPTLTIAEETQSPPEKVDRKKAGRGTSVKTQSAKPNSFTDWCLAFFTAALVGIAVYQFIMMRGQLDVMRKDQRAWIAVTLKSEDYAPLLTANLSVKNYGKTPASKIIGVFYIEVVPNGAKLKFDSDIIHDAFENKILMPDADLPETISRKAVQVFGNEPRGVNYPLTPEEKSSLDDGSSWTAVHGFVTYDDIYGVRHFNKFCFWRGQGNQQLQSFDCVNYNEMDDK